jgi:hypothetical protein
MFLANIPRKEIGEYFTYFVQFEPHRSMIICDINNGDNQLKHIITRNEEKPIVLNTISFMMDTIKAMRQSYDISLEGCEVVINSVPGENNCLRGNWENEQAMGKWILDQRD